MFLLGACLLRCLDACAAHPATCRTEVVEAQVSAGDSFAEPIGSGLLLVMQPIASGWILRVLPRTTNPAAIGQPGFVDYAELATPPYQSVSPLSLSTDFAFRSQDAVGWNPRRFRFATSTASFTRLAAAYRAFEQAGTKPALGLVSALASEVSHAAEGVFTVLDARLIPGIADQGGAAAAVSAAFPNTAHTLVQGPAGTASALGHLLEVRFRVELELPPDFAVEPGAPSKAGVTRKIVPHLCGTR